MELTLEQLQKLQKDLNEVNSKLQNYEIQKQVKTQELKNILTKYEVSTVPEFKKKKELVEKDAEKLFLDVSTYISEMTDKISQLDRTLQG